MKKQRFTEEQIIAVLKEQEAGCSTLGRHVTDVTNLSYQYSRLSRIIPEQGLSMMGEISLMDTKFSAVGIYSERTKTSKFSLRKRDSIDIDFGDSPPSVRPEELDQVKLAAKRQMYREITGADPSQKSERKLDKALFARLPRQPGDDCVKIAVRDANPRNPTESYLSAMKDFEKHKPNQFQQKYIDAAISHFERLGPEKADERQRLAEAFERLKKGGQLHFNNRDRLKTLELTGRGESRNALERAQRDLAHVPQTMTPSEMRREILLTSRARAGLCR